MTTIGFDTDDFESLFLETIYIVIIRLFIVIMLLVQTIYIDAAVAVAAADDNKPDDIQMLVYHDARAPYRLSECPPPKKSKTEPMCFFWGEG